MGKDHGGDGIQERTDGCEHHAVEARVQQRASGGDAVARTADGGGDDHAVTAQTAHLLPVHADVHVDEPREGRPAEDDVIDGHALGERAFIAYDFPLQGHTGTLGSDACQGIGKALLPLLRLDVGQEADPAEIDAQQGDAPACHPTGHTQHGAVPSQDNGKIQIGKSIGGMVKPSADGRDRVSPGAQPGTDFSFKTCRTVTVGLADHENMAGFALHPFSLRYRRAQCKWEEAFYLVRAVALS